MSEAISRRSFVASATIAAAVSPFFASSNAALAEESATEPNCIERVTVVYASPVGRTRKVSTYIAGLIAQLLDCELIEINATDPATRQTERTFGPNELLILASPTMRGQLPAHIGDDFATYLHGSDTPAIAISTFGNRAFDNSLAYMNEVLNTNGFLPFSAAAFCCQHEFTAQLGTGRPDDSDMRAASAFAARSVTCLKTIDVPNPLAIPGSADAEFYVPVGLNGEPVHFQDSKPTTDLSKCIACGICAEVCPLGSIDPAQFDNVSGACIKCHACVKKCPQQAKYFDSYDLLTHIKQLERDHSTRQENAFFYADEV